MASVSGLSGTDWGVGGDGEIWANVAGEEGSDDSSADQEAVAFVSEPAPVLVGGWRRLALDLSGGAGVTGCEYECGAKTK